MKWETCIGSAAWGFRELELSRQLTVAKEYAMACHELGIANAETDIPLDASGEELEAVKGLYRARGIGLTCAATGNDFTGEDAEAQLKKVLRVIEMCEALEVKMLRVFAGFTPLAEMTEEKWHSVLACLKTAAQAAKSRGVALCVETHGAVEPMLDGVRHIRSATTQRQDLLRILEAAEVKLVFDPANLYAAGERDLNGFFDAVKDRIGYIHLKDFRRGGEGQLYPCALGEGSTVWDGLLPRLAETGAPILFEYENPQDLEAGLEKCVTYWKENAL